MAGRRDHLAIARGRLLGHAVVFAVGVDLFVAALVIGVPKCLWFVRQCGGIQCELSLLLQFINQRMHISFHIKHF